MPKPFLTLVSSTVSQSKELGDWNGTTTGELIYPSPIDPESFTNLSMDGLTTTALILPHPEIKNRDDLEALIFEEMNRSRLLKDPNHDLSDVQLISQQIINLAHNPEFKLGDIITRTKDSFQRRKLQREQHYEIAALRNAHSKRQRN